MTSSDNLCPTLSSGRRSWKGCKPNSVCPAARPGRESFVCAASTRDHPAQGAETERAAPWSPIWPCTRWGFPCLGAHASSGGLLLHLFTLTPPRKGRGGLIFCGTVRRDASRHRLPRVSPAQPGLRGIAPFGVRTFLPLRIPSPRAILRLPRIYPISSIKHPAWR
jgi:hypothetical protein